MNIAFVGQKGFPALKGGGVEAYVENLATRLAKDNRNVVFVYNRKHYAQTESHYKKVNIINTSSIKTKHLDAITHTLTSLFNSLFIPNLNVLHVNSVGPALLLPIARGGFFIKYLITGQKTKLVFTFHSADWEHQKWSKFACLMLKAGAFIGGHTAHEVITVSESLKRKAWSMFGIKATYVPNGTNIYGNIGYQHLAKFGLVKKEYIVFISRLVKHKNAHIVIQAFKALKTSQRQGKKLVIVGEPAFTDSYLAYLKDLAGDDADIIFTGFQTGATLKQLFANAALYVAPSSSEGLSIALLEAGSYSLPVIVSNIPENKEVVRSFGYYVKPERVQPLTRQFISVLNKPEEAQRKADLLHNRIKEVYSWISIVRSIEQIYSQGSVHGDEHSPVFTYR